MGGIECVEVLGAAISGTPLAHESREPWGLAEHVVRCGGPEQMPTEVRREETEFPPHPN